MRPITALVWDKNLQNALNAVGKELTSSEAYAAIFEAGVMSVLEDNGDRDREMLLDLEVQEALDELERQKEHKRRMAELYEKMGLDRFVEWAEERDVDWEAFLDDYRLFRRQEAKSWSEEAWVWLRDHLGDGEPVDTDVVKAAAIEAGIVDSSTPENEQRDWAKLRQVASRHDLTRDYGKWQYKPELIPFYHEDL